MTEIERLQRRLFEKGTTDFHVWWGPDAKTLSPEDKAALINRMLDQRGSPMTELPRSEHSVDVRELVAEIAGRDADTARMAKR